MQIVSTLSSDFYHCHTLHTYAHTHTYIHTHMHIYIYERAYKQYWNVICSLILEMNIQNIANFNNTTHKPSPQTTVKSIAKVQ
jgi:hypothetical protein